MGLKMGSPLWTRRRVLQSGVALAASGLLPGCSSSTTVPAPIISPPTPPTQPNLNPQPAPTGPMTQASVTVSATAGGGIAAGVGGLSYEKSTLYEPLFTGANSNLIGLFERLGPSVLRIGGNSVDRNIWTANGKGQTSGQIAPSDVNAVAAFVKAAGWKCLYGVNLGGSATGVQTPALAAAEVAYAVQQFGSSLLGIEIGNECDLYGNSGNYYAGNWSLAQFEALWAQYRTAILASAPGVTITGPASAGSESSWTVPFGQSVKGEITLLTQHYYRANGDLPTSTGAFLVTPDATLVKDLATLQTGAQGIGIPYRMSECNSFYNGGSNGVSDSYASSLWVIDYLFNCAQGGAVGVNLHGGGNSAGYTPIADSSGVVGGARPEYYGGLLFTLAGAGRLYQAAATLVAMTQLTSGASAPDLSATAGVTIQGVSVQVDGTFSPAAAYTLTASGSSVSCYVPALSAVLIQIS